MKTIVNIIVTAFVVGLKACMVPAYLIWAPFVTAYRWGGLRHLRYSIPFECKCVWHTLRSDWHDGCEAFIFDLATPNS